MQHCAQCFFAVFAASINHSLRHFVFFFFLITTSKEVLGKGLFLKLVTRNSISTDKPKVNIAPISPLSLLQCSCYGYLRLLKATRTN